MVLQEPIGDAEPYLDSGNGVAGHCSNDFVNGGGWFGSFTVAIVLCVNYVFTVAWLSGRTSVSGRRTFPVLRSTCS